MKNANARIYALAVVVIAIWSSTFVSTKVLLSAFTPIEILVYRFALAYLMMFLVYPRVHKPESLRTELLLALAGITGGSLYFVAENFALKISLASNVSLIVSTAPILTAIVAHIILKDEKITRNIIGGAVVAFLGAALVILNGTFVLKLNPLGDCLALASSFSWAVYSVAIRKLDSKRPSYYITRKIFFWTLVTIIPVLFIASVRFDFRPLLDWKISANLLFLTLFASCGAYVAWNRVVWTLGATKANNFIYFIPLLTLVESAILIAEPLTPFAIGGAALIFVGVYITSRKTRNRAKEPDTDAANEAL
jgi:drug/metabolite transporter (DMT)-like permease